MLLGALAIAMSSRRRWIFKGVWRKTSAGSRLAAETILPRAAPHERILGSPSSESVFHALVPSDPAFASCVRRLVPRTHVRSAHSRSARCQACGPGPSAAAEPLDCDEAAYAYIGHRILLGDVMYRDLTENKPPLGYWLYTLAVAVGGYHELAIRVMPIPFVLATIALVWWIAPAPRRAGIGMPCRGLFAILSTDPYLFGNGANLEHFINFFAVASLALLVRGWDRIDRWSLVGSGVCLGAATLVKQVAIVPAVVFVAALAWRAWSQEATWQRKSVRGLLDIVSFGLGVVSILVVAATILIARGAGAAAYDDIFHYGSALATDTLPEPNAPPGVIRWITGNADPKGQLPWPFGTTNYLVWWGTASWPLWLVSIPALAHLLLGPHTTPERRLVAGWTLAAWAQVTLPGLYWPHYYLLPIAGTAITVAVCWADAVSVIGHALRFRAGEAPSEVDGKAARTEPRPPEFSASHSAWAARSRDGTGPEKTLCTSIGATGSSHVSGPGIGDLRDPGSRSPRLPARPS